MASREPHSLLLVEPVAVPKIDHTGVNLSLFSDTTPLYYPNGAKRVNIRETIAATLREVYVQPKPQAPPVHDHDWVSSTNKKDVFDIGRPEVSIHDEKFMKKVEQELKSKSADPSFIGPSPKPSKSKGGPTSALPSKGSVPKGLCKSLDGTTVVKSEREVIKNAVTRQLLRNLRSTNQMMDRMGRIK